MHAHVHAEQNGTMPGTVARPANETGRWRPVVESYLSDFASIGPSDVDRAEQWAANSSMFYATGSWRAKVVGGALYVKFIRAHSHWAERASVLRMVLEALEGYRGPDFELVYA